MTEINYRSHLHDLKDKGICPFCQEQTCAVDENKYAFVLPARAPYREDHVLICPKRHAETLADFSPEELSDIYELITKWELLLYREHGELVVFLRQGSVGGTTGKTIHHLHRHIVPHFEIKYGGTQETSDARTVYNDKKYTDIQEHMKKYIS